MYVYENTHTYIVSKHLKPSNKPLQYHYPLKLRLVRLYTSMHVCNENVEVLGTLHTPRNYGKNEEGQNFTHLPTI